MKPKWRKFEDKLAKELNGKRNKASGGLWYNPSDIKTDVYLVEAKQTDKKSYSITLEKWDKIYEEALFSKRIPLLAIQIKDTELIVLSKKDFLTFFPSQK